ncbi:hypothetical protein KDA_09780 [Dictyobacter alpinus]|uniref:Lipoprotein n=1 Tax=Dictyobacter alpinus TaxID=2014873 RepID=A0A402B2A7_9CHLR|nr:hypothetical protein [Dictyobacter alpinus]GCE25494.1 hypothetical protein KDA_09780 [Dictyobacter alpinus]
MYDPDKTMPLPLTNDTPRPQPPNKKYRLGLAMIIAAIVLLVISVLIFFPFIQTSTNPQLSNVPTRKPTPTRILPTPTPTPTPFDPAVGAILPNYRVIAFYAVPGAEVTGPAYAPDAQMLTKLKAQSDAYEKLDATHPVKMGIDLVVSVPDNYPGPDHTYSHHVDNDTIQHYIDFCQNNNLLLFLDLNFGQAVVKDELAYFMPYLEHYTFVHMAIDPEWMFPRHDGIPGTNLSNVRATDLNPAIEELAALPMKYHVPRKILIIHQYRGDGDTLATPFDAGQAEIADKRNLFSDPRVDVVLHVDSVGGFPGDHQEKVLQYSQWVKDDMHKYNNFKYGGFKIFYRLEAPTGLMTPQEILAMDPPPMVVTYGN